MDFYIILITFICIVGSVCSASWVFLALVLNSVCQARVHLPFSSFHESAERVAVSGQSLCVSKRPLQCETAITHFHRHQCHAKQSSTVICSFMNSAALILLVPFL